MRNGLLLRSDIHTLFDLNLLGIDSKARIVVSGRLKQTSYWSLNGKPATLPKATASRPSKKLLAERLGSLVVDVKPAGR